MKDALHRLVILVLIAFVGAPAMAQEKIQLLYKAKVGQVIRYKSDGTLYLEAGGMKLTLELEQTEKATITDVSASGNITIEREVESEEVKLNGQRMPSSDSEKQKSTFTLASNGTLVAYKSTASDTSDQAKMVVRLFQATNPVFADEPVGVGDKWTYEYKPNSDVGTVAARAEYEVLAAEKVAEADTFKIKMTYRELEGSPALSATNTIWVEKTSGDAVVAETEVENVPFGSGAMKALGSGKIRQERTAGSPIGGGKPDTGPEKKKEKTIDEVVKDTEKLPGLFTLYRKKEAGRDTLYMEIREDQLDKMLMLEVTIGTGTSQNQMTVAGNPVDNIYFQFTRYGDDRIVMRMPNRFYRADKDKPIARAIERSFAEAYLESFKIEAKQPDRQSLLINIGDIFRGDIARISNIFSGGLPPLPIPGLSSGRTSYTLDKELTQIQNIKVFPENIVVETQYHFTGSGAQGVPLGFRAWFWEGPLADPRSIPLRVTYVLIPLADTGYRPRLADPRVGYFTVNYQDFNTDNQYDPIVRYINRWHLEKADPKATLSPPKKPIVFWLDNAIPLEYRDAVREGILWWNRAFEKIGIKDAIVVKQMPDKPEFDYADARYNIVRWVTSANSAYAMALPRVNPFTGEIFGAGITIDANIMRYAKLQRKDIVAPSSYFEDLSPQAKTFHPSRCEIASGAMQQAWFGLKALQLLHPASSKIDERAYAHAFLRAIVAHEMGHVLGLRHNFIASTYCDLEKLKSPQVVREGGISASVMDYLAFNIAAIKTQNVDYWTPTLGRYDYWAIQYGYMPIDAKTPEGELPKLQALAARCNEPGHAYQPDEVADQFDPKVTRFDLSADPLRYWIRNLRVSRYLLFHLAQRVPKKGQSYWEFTRDFLGLLNIYSQAAARTSQYIGGLYLNRNHKGDPGERPTLVPIDGAEQKKALETLTTYVFAENAFSFPKSYFQYLTSQPYGDMDIATMLSGATSDYPIMDTFANIQRAALRRIFSTPVLRRIVNNEFKEADATRVLTLPLLFRLVESAAWSELGGRRNIEALRRQLQRAHLDILIGMVINPPVGTPEDAKVLAWAHLRQLRDEIASARRAARYDDYTRVHLEESLMRINRALDARQIIGTPSAPTPSLLQMLLGGEEVDKGTWQ
jgi:hypothetical protein